MSKCKTNHINNIKKNKIIIVIIIIILFIIAISFICFILIKNNKNKDNKIKIEEESVIPKTFTKEEIEIAKYNTVIKLNDIKIPSSQSNILYDEIHLDNFYRFSYNFFVDLNYNNFSPLKNN